MISFLDTLTTLVEKTAKGLIGVIALVAGVWMWMVEKVQRER
jgi:hypothetical protein